MVIIIIIQQLSYVCIETKIIYPTIVPDLLCVQFILRCYFAFEELQSKINSNHSYQIAIESSNTIPKDSFKALLKRFIQETAFNSYSNAFVEDFDGELPPIYFQVFKSTRQH
ncbi:hypothetical protein ACTA71_006851 [Dictyostelium dimigraforme]